MPNLDFGRNPSNRSVADILADSEKILKERPSTISYLQPCRNVVYYEFLGELLDKPLLHFYDKQKPPSLPALENWNIILHSHSYGTGCYTPTFCHILGYEPTGAEHPAFIKAFNQMWKEKL